MCFASYFVYANAENVDRMKTSPNRSVLYEQDTIGYNRTPQDTAGQLTIRVFYIK